MGLISWIERSAAGRAHVLVIEAPGHWQTRAAVERAALARGWRLASSPADADVLAVCGRPGPQLEALIDRVWEQIPDPRVRVDVHQLDDVAARLGEARTALLDTVHLRQGARSRPTSAPEASSDSADGQMDHGEMGHGEMGHGEMGHGEMDHGEMDHGQMGHGEMDHGEMDMSPSGIPLAGSGEDRDGMEMDVLHVPLGPVLPHWPAGLVVRCALQGDVITEATAELLDDVTTQATGRIVMQQQAPSAVRARRLDNVVGLLALAGWDDAASQARLTRDAVLADGTDDSRSVAALARLDRRIRRSRILRWSLRGIRPLDAADLQRQGLPASFLGDTYDRLVRMVDGLKTDAASGPVSPHQLPGLITGLDLATARLVLASLDLHQLSPDRTATEVVDG
ncbi:hypothetical protein BH09ACT11_BH09ACT11_06750 [soil metagenome]